MNKWVCYIKMVVLSFKTLIIRKESMKNIDRNHRYINRNNETCGSNPAKKPAVICDGV